jgi:hypothetical protein
MYTPALLMSATRRTERIPVKEEIRSLSKPPTLLTQPRNG